MNAPHGQAGEKIARCAELGFSHVAFAHETDAPADETARALREVCDAANLGLLLDLSTYSGFELCEFEALPGREEYRDSEKYELKFRDWNVPGNIKWEVATLNRLRRSEPALQSHLGTTFYNAFNDNILDFGRHTGRGSDRILVAISLNPNGPEEADFEIPLWEWDMPDSGALLAHDLLRGGSFIWHGKKQHMWLRPDAPFCVWRVSPAEVS